MKIPTCRVVEFKEQIPVESLSDGKAWFVMKDFVSVHYPPVNSIYVDGRRLQSHPNVLVAYACNVVDDFGNKVNYDSRDLTHKFWYYYALDTRSTNPSLFYKD